MKILQKIFASILLISFSLAITNANLIYYDTNYYTKQVIITKKELASDKKFSRYILKIDKIFSKIGKNKEKLEKLQDKIRKIKTIIYTSKNKEKYSKYSKLINYLETNINLYLYEIIKKIKEEKEKQAEIKLEKMKTYIISMPQKNEVEEKILKIQKTLLNSTKGNFENLMKNFDKLTNYEEKGNLKITFDLDQELIGKIKTNIELQNYKAKNSGFDSELKGKLKALIEASVKGQEDFKLEFNTFLNFISKDGNTYLLFEKLNIINDSNKAEIKKVFKKLKEIAAKNKYIKFEDRDTKQALELIKNINPKKIFSDAETTLEKPLFTAYQKEENKYYLIPTKYACDTYKEIIAKFDPWNGNTCSDSQYKDMLKELSKTGDLTLEIGAKNKLNFVAYPSYGVESFNTELIFTDKNIESLHSQLIAKKDGEGFELSYVKNNKLAFYLNAGKQANIDFKSTLDNNNKFSSIDFTMNTKGYRNDFNAKLTLKNKNISANLTTFDEQEKEYLNITTTGKYDTNYLELKNKIELAESPFKALGGYTYLAKNAKVSSDLAVITQLINIEYTKGTFINLKELELKNNKINFKLLKQNPLNFKQPNGDDYLIFIKENYFQVYGYKVDENGNKIAVIKGNYYQENKEKPKSLVKINGKYIQNFDIVGKDNTFIKQENQKVEANINIKADARNNKNNANIFINYKEGKKEILRIEIDNKGTINYKKVEIKAPTNVIDSSELINNSMNY